MKLYYSSGACSLAPHIALREAGADFEMEKVDTSTKTTETGRDFWKINPKGYVPTIELDDGEVMTEGVALMQYIADQAPASKLAPANGEMDRYRLQEWLNFITTELHKGIGGFFNEKLRESAYAEGARERVYKRFDYIEHALKAQKGDYLMGGDFTVADAYLFTVLRWTKKTGFDLGTYPKLSAFMDRVAARPAVQAAMKAEGITYPVS